MQNRMESILEWIPFSEILHPSEFWLFTVVPLAMCLLGVHIFFRHFVTIAWFSVKFCVAGLVYLQIRDVVTSAVHVNTQWSIESALFGVPAGTLNTAVVLGFNILKSKCLFTLREAYSRHIPPQEPTPWVDWMKDTLFI